MSGKSPFPRRPLPCMTGSAILCVLIWLSLTVITVQASTPLQPGGREISDGQADQIERLSRSRVLWVLGPSNTPPAATGVVIHCDGLILANDRQVGAPPQGSEVLVVPLATCPQSRWGWSPDRLVLKTASCAEGINLV
jgi:hypothetical protein